MTATQLPEHETLTIVPDLDSTGLVTYWRLSGVTELPRLRAAWMAAGLDEALLPAAPSDEIALRRAVAELGTKRRLIRPLARRGVWAIVSETVRQDALDYDVECRVRWDGGRAVVEPSYHELADKIREGFERHRGELSSADISAFLVKLCEKNHAASLRDSGGVYFLPRDVAPFWRKAAGAVEAAAEHRVFRIPAVKNEEVVDAVLAAVQTEADAALGEITAELDRGQENDDEALGRRALASRAVRCQELLGKVGVYERLFGVRLDAIRQNVSVMEARLAAAVLAAQPDEDAAA
jgi:hypothetical protein